MYNKSDIRYQTSENVIYRQKIELKKDKTITISETITTIQKKLGAGNIYVK